MTGKVSGIDIPSDLDDDDVASEANFFNPVYDSIVALDGAVGKAEPVQVSGTPVIITNSSAKTTLLSYTVAADELGTNNIIEFEIRGSFYNESGGDASFDIEFAYDDTTITADPSSAGSSSTKHHVVISGSVMCDGAADSQLMELKVTDIRTNSGTDLNDWAGVLETAAEDSSGELTLTVSCTLSAANANLTFKAYWHKVILHDVS